MGKSIISTIYINDLVHRQNKPVDENYTFNEISLLYLWGDKIIFSNNVNKNKEIKINVFSYIGELLNEILELFKLKIFPIINNIKSFENIKNNFIKLYYK